jgi:hypothetical protein
VRGRDNAVMLYEAAQIMLVRLAKWSWLKAWAMKIARHRGMKKAIVALARTVTEPRSRAGAQSQNIEFTMKRLREPIERATEIAK